MIQMAENKETTIYKQSRKLSQNLAEDISELVAQYQEKGILNIDIIRELSAELASVTAQLTDEETDKKC